MGFIADLREGLPGLKMNLPESWQVQEDQPRRAILMDNDHRVGWHLIHGPFHIDLRQEHDAALRKDVERHTRHAFAEQYALLQFPPEQAAQRAPVRTADPNWPGWTPLIEVEYVQIGGTTALKVLRRLVYERGLEVVLGTLLVPVASGLCELTAFSRTGETGARETVLLDLAMQQHPGKRRDELLRQLGQSFLDDARHDAKFPEHPLTLVRQALRWLTTGNDNLQVLAPPPPVAGGEVLLPAASTALQPPPRYVPVNMEAMPAPKTMAVLARVTLEGVDHPRLLDVWHLPDLLILGDDREAQLTELARRSVGEWERQGATAVEAQVQTLPPQGKLARVGAQIRMMLGGAPAQSVSRWLVDEDGSVFRIALGAPPYVPMDELVGEADQVMNSWRRLRPAKSAWLTSDLRLRDQASQAKAQA